MCILAYGMHVLALVMSATKENTMSDTITLFKTFPGHGVQVTFQVWDFDVKITWVESGEDYSTEDTYTMPKGDARIEYQRLVRQGYSVSEIPF